MAAEKTYRLASGPMVHTPGLLAWAINGYKFPKDRPALLRVFTQTYAGSADNPGPPKDVFHRLLAGEIEWGEKSGGVVEFTA